MEDDSPTPPTQPSGALVPPSKLPPTAVALATPDPLPNPQQRTTRRYADLNPVQRFLSRTLDLVDDFADTVADGLGLRGT
ncbi:MAG TPA: hypothetical protein VIP11_20910 [Gemmatimonadaceae bacterium]